MMNARYYVTSIEFNKVAQAENRTQPFGFNSIDDAKKKFYTVLSQDIGNPTLSWCNVIMWDNYGNMLQHEFWHEQVQADTEE